MINKKIFFIHIPKCAGSALLRLLENKILCDHRVGKVYDAESYQNSAQVIARSDLIAGHFGYDYFSKYTDDKFVLTFLRNPVERILSHYSYWKENNFPSPGAQQAKKLSLKDFLLLQSDDVFTQFSNIQSWMLISDYRKNSRKPYINYSHNELVELACNRLLEMDFIGVSELYESSVDTLINKLNLEVTANMKNNIKNKVNKTKNRLQKEELDDETLELINRYTCIDEIVYKEALKLNSAG